MSGRRDDAEPHDPTIGAMYRKAADEFPAPDLDRRVLAAAHRAVGSRPHETRRDPDARSWMRRWSVPFSVAATLVVSVSLVTTILLEQPAETSHTESPAQPDEFVRQPAPQPAPHTAPPPSQASPRYAPQPAPQAAPQAAPESRGARKAPAEPAGASAARERGQSAERPSPASSTDPSRADRQAADTAKSHTATRDPGQWLTEIEAQFHRGDTETAKRSLQAFREQFPERPVPASVQALDRE